MNDLTKQLAASRITDDFGGQDALHAQDVQAFKDQEWLARFQGWTEATAVIGAIAIAAVLWFASPANADAPGPHETFKGLICDPISGQPVTLAPQFGPKAPPLPAKPSKPALPLIPVVNGPDHPPHGGGGEEPPPAPVDGPPAGVLLASALGVFAMGGAAWRGLKLALAFV